MIANNDIMVKGQLGAMLLHVVCTIKIIEENKLIPSKPPFPWKMTLYTCPSVRMLRWE